MEDDFIDDLGGLFDPGDLFDLDGDGVHSFDETIMAEDFCNETSTAMWADSDEDEWTTSYELGLTYDLDPNDFDNEEEYLQAIEDAKNEELSQDDEDDIQDISSVDDISFKNERSKEAMERLERLKDIRRKDAGDILSEKRCEFILNNPTIIAAQYLTQYGDLLVVQAIQDNFELPFDFPIEDTDVVTSFREYVAEMSISHSQLCLDTWDWALKEFLAYEEYGNSHSWGELSEKALNEIYYKCSDEFKMDFLDYLDSHPDFIENLSKAIPIDFDSCDWTVMYGLGNKKTKGAFKLYSACLNRESFSLEGKIHSIDGMFDWLSRNNQGCCSWRRAPLVDRDLTCELEEEDKLFYLFVKNIYYTTVKNMKEPRIQNQFKKWDKIVNDYYYDYHL